MKKITVSILALAALSGCSTLESVGNHAYESAFPNPRTYGYASYDPCVRCGEDWIFLNLDETKELNK
jgi:uncharacterized protein YceK